MAFPVAASGCLCDGVKARQGAENHGKINVHTCFNQLGGNQPDGALISQATFDEIEDGAPVGGTHQGGQMEA